MKYLYRGQPPKIGRWHCPDCGTIIEVEPNDEIATRRAWDASANTFPLQPRPPRITVACPVCDGEMTKMWTATATMHPAPIMATADAWRAEEQMTGVAFGHITEAD